VVVEGLSVTSSFVCFSFASCRAFVDQYLLPTCVAVTAMLIF
jgi:hypothetical protein